MYKVSCTKLVYHLSISDNSSGYEQTLREKNMQLMALQFYINNIPRCLDIVDILYARRKYHQFKNFTSVLISYKLIIYKSPSLWYLPIPSEHPTSQRRCKVSRYSEYFICKETILTVKNQLYINTLKGILVYWIFYLQGDKINSATLSQVF